MSMAISTLCFSNPSLKLPSKLSRQTHLRAKAFNSTLLFRTHPNRTQPFSSTPSTHNFSPLPWRKLGFSWGRNIGFVLKSGNREGGEEKSTVDEAEQEARGRSTMPDRFRYLTKEAPDRPVRWPYLIAVTFLVYAWRTVLWELYNWKKAVVGIFHFLGYLSKLALALIFHFIGDPVTSCIRGIETALYAIRAAYSGIINYTPVPEVMTTIALASAVLAIGEAAVPDSVYGQPFLITAAGVIGYAAVRGFISELFFWTILVGLVGFALFVKKRDYVSSTLPAAAALAAVGETWIRLVVMGSFLALAITQHWKNPSDGKEGEVTTADRGVPIPLLCLGFLVGLRLAAKWAGTRHLSWMVA